MRGLAPVNPGPRILALLAALALAGPAARAQDDWSVTWRNGLEIGSKGGEHRLKLSGLIQADATAVEADDPLVESTSGDGFEFRRAQVVFQGTLYERVTFKAQYDFAGGDADIKDVWVGLTSGWGEVRFGHFKEPFSLEELTSSKHLAFLERSLPVLAFAPSRNSGIGAHGQCGGRCGWSVGAFYEADDFGISEDEDATNLTARVAFRPVDRDDGRRLLHLGAAVSHKATGETFRFRARPEAHFSGRFVSTPSFAADSALLYDLELAGVFDRFWLAGEFIQAASDAPAFGDPGFGGFYVQAGWFLTGEHRRFKRGDGTFDRQKPSDAFGKGGGRGAWEIALRYSSLDLTDAGVRGGEQDDWTLGVNWYLNPAARLMLNLVRAEVEGVGDASFLLMRWQVDF